MFYDDDVLSGMMVVKSVVLASFGFSTEVTFKTEMLRYTTSAVMILYEYFNSNFIYRAPNYKNSCLKALYILR